MIEKKTSAIFHAKAPGSLMLVGEHAVLRGGIGIAAAINQWIDITLTPRTDDLVFIDSILGNEKTNIHALNVKTPFQFVLAALKVFQKEFPCGFNLKIESDFSSTVGFGSSAAVTVATILVCQKWLSSHTEKLLTFKLAKEAMLSAQKMGSGTDIAASIFGGIIAYEMDPIKIEHLPCIFPITAVYSGSKTPTVEVLQLVEKAYKRDSEYYERIFSEMKKIAFTAKTALQENNLVDLSECFREYQKQMIALGVSNDVLDALVSKLEMDPEISAAKISGSGLGDCVIGIGKSCTKLLGFQQWSLEIADIQNSNSKKMTVDKILSGKSKKPVARMAQAFAPVNIALIKYWGKRDEILNLPLTSSLSIALPHLGSHTKISYAEKTQQDRIFLNGVLQNPVESFSKKISQFLDLFRPSHSTYYQIETKNDIPTAAGLASSASGFAALVLALNQFYGWDLSKKELSILCRLGSGSASRSLWNGFVEWHRGEREDGMDSFAEPLKVEWPELKIGLLMISAEKKSISSREAMSCTVHTVPRFKTDWPTQVEKDLKNLKMALETKNFDLLGNTAEQNALAMHALMKEATPSIDYCLPETLAAREKIWSLRKQDIPIFFTQDAGPNLKILFLEKNRIEITKKIPNIL